MNILSTLKKSRVTQLMLRCGFQLMTLMPKNKKLVIFESFNGRQFSDNPRAIYENLIKEEIDYKMVWSVDSKHIKQFENNNAQYVKRFTFRWFYLLATAKYWVTNSRFPLWFPKSKRTVYLQTWHGTPLKKLGVDIEEVHMPGTNTEQYKQNFTREASKWDYLISPNSYSSEIFRRAFGFQGEMLEYGYPRNDLLITGNNADTINQLRKNINLPTDKKVILYAPTWRDDEYYDRGKYKFTVKMDLKKMKKALGEDYIILLRLHYLVSEHLDLTEHSGFVYDVSSYEDIRHLYLISDMLITDYSSVFFDYAILKRPMFFYAYDIDTYRDKLRGFYFDFEQEAPGPLLKTDDELLQAILHVHNEGYMESRKVEIFRERFTKLEDGHASERVTQRVFKNSKGVSYEVTVQNHQRTI